MVRSLQAWSTDGPAVLLLTPTPIDDTKRSLHETSRWGHDASDVLWSDAQLAPYVEACHAVGASTGAAVVDLHKAFSTAPDLSCLLMDDGMHPTSDGGELIYNSIVETINQKLPHLRPTNYLEAKEHQAPPSGRLYAPDQPHATRPRPAVHTCVVACCTCVQRASNVRCVHRVSCPRWQAVRLPAPPGHRRGGRTGQR
jgi:hypothetical protein